MVGIFKIKNVAVDAFMQALDKLVGKGVLILSQPDEILTLGYISQDNPLS